MATGYEVQMYHDIHRISVDLDRIAKAFEVLTELVAKELAEDEEGADAATFLAMTKESNPPQ